MAAEYRGHNIGRRRFVQGAGAAGFGLLACCTLPSPRASQPAKVTRIGWLGPEGADVGPGSNVDAFRQGMHELGYVEGQHYVLETRFAEGHLDRHRALAAELLTLDVDIFVAGAPGAIVLKEANTTLPIVTFMGDPVGQGLVASLARPVGNITGLSILGPELTGKRLELLKAAVPTLIRVAILRTTLGPAQSMTLPAVVEALGLQAELVPVGSPEELSTAFSAVTDWGAEAIIVSGPGALTHRARVLEFAAQQRLPAMYEWKAFVEAGGLMAYIPSLRHLHFRAAYYVDRILKGAKPADLPVEQPTTFDLVINLQTARALGLTIPQHVLLQTTEVIQ